MGYFYRQIHRRVSQLKLDPQTFPAPMAGDGDAGGAAGQVSIGYFCLSLSKLIGTTKTKQAEVAAGCWRIFRFDSGLSFENVHQRNPRSYNLEIQVLKVISVPIFISFSVKKRKIHFQLNVMMVATFFIIWSPYAIVSVVSLYYPDLSAFW